jgi:hypothetical protein
VPTKLQIGRQLKKRKNKKKKKNRENRIERELQILEKTNNAPVIIYLESTVGSCCVLDMLFLSLSYTNGPEGLEGTQSVGQQTSSESSWKTKRKYTCIAVWSPDDFSLFHHWIMLILGYVVCLEFAFILDGGDRKLILQQGLMHCEQ